jgi:imidazolonepropionase-like amidohydrolase
MRRVNTVTVAATVALAAAAGFAVPAYAQTVTAFEGVRIIVGNESAPIENATLVVEGNKIVQAGRAADVRVPAGATRVNLAGKTVMPAIIDTHVHLSATREKLVNDLKRRGYFGVSAALSLGVDNLELLPVRYETIPGAARFFSAGRGVTRTEPMRPTYQINSEEEGRQAVRANVANKVEIIKVWVDDRDGKVQKVTPAQYAAVIDEAHKLGVRVIAHIFNMDDAKGLMRAGLDAFAHGVRDRDVDDETVAMFKERPNIVLGPNLPDRGVKVDLSWLKAGLPAEEFAKLEKENTDRPKVQEFHGIQARNLAKMNAAGVRLTLGTDGNKAWGPHEEMQDMVLAGVPVPKVIMAATRNGAEFLRIAGEAGTLEAGKSADFIVLDANPLDDITNTRKISAVYLRGAAVDRSNPVP